MIHGFPLPPPMQRALALAEAAGRCGEIPIGAVILHRGRIVAEAANETRSRPDPTAHAELLAIRRAADALGQERLTDCTLFVTLEPCAMCAGAIAHARLAVLHYGAEDPKGGGVAHGARVFSHPTCHHRPLVYGGIGAERSAAMLRRFFAERRVGADGSAPADDQ
ncbi:tRNA(adenine34) deaminase [Sphingomonas jejuensis]|uniref:tRNA-specific adenosine deaminase n=1 Tax=Sphingomonas jejuensis TaxID=904715 RepID=A0ABX0XMQ5_9SPHN|nr:nucleoside deaminase [Sphingomonas jejuensis]NJC34555.1 tRNA(adenine34) deaminase [Sphingomonas jejuensis]